MTTSKEAIEILGGESQQFLDDDHYLFNSQSIVWTPTNASLVVEKTNIFPVKPTLITSTYRSLRIQPLSFETAPTFTEFSISSGEVVISKDYNTDSLVAHTFVYSFSPVKVAFSLSNGATTVESNYVDVVPLTWTSVSSDELPIPVSLFDSTCTVEILFKTLYTTHVHIAHPVLTNNYGFTTNRFVRETWGRLPQYIRETDSVQINPSFPLARIVDVGLTYAGQALSQLDTFQYRDKSAGYDANDDSTKSVLVNADIVGRDYIPWLGQFVGVQFTSAVTATTPWSNLPATWDEIHLDIDPTADITYTISSISRDGSGAATATLTSSPSGLSQDDTISIAGTVAFNGQFVLTSVNTGTNEIQWYDDGASTSESSGTVTLVDEEWIEIETFDLSGSDNTSSQRELIKTGRTGINGGTYQAMIDSINGILTGTKTVIFDVDGVAAPWTILVKTLTSETPLGVANTESSILVSALRSAKPLGFVVNHLCADTL